MGNTSSEPKKRPRTLHELSTKVGEYRTINEGDPEMMEDPEFPQKMMKEALNNNTTVDGNNVQGTFVYYPNKRKPKMWIGNYKILNPEDILCINVAEKIGITEEEWKNYLNKKTKSQEEEGKVEVVPNFEYAPDEQSMSLKEILKKESLKDSHDKTDEFLHCNSSELIRNSSLLNKAFVDVNENDSIEYSVNNRYVVRSTGDEEDVYYDMRSTRGEEMEGIHETEGAYEANGVDEVDEEGRQANKGKWNPRRDNHIRKLNEEGRNISAQEGNFVKEKKKELYAYSKASTNHMIMPKKNESFFIKDIEKKKYNKKSIIAELIRENKNKINSRFSSINEKKKKERYVNLSSMSTKGSFGRKKSTVHEDIPNKIAYLKKTVVT
ncbi:conserved Plasmodium protein, unknown function [Plasmodium ovale]|uniref:Uncharacterized protein n=2 Tax=Plasmodium ovale TaxID=36330 RepID=A0A1A8WWV0_PLAOA|nr:hypothetical protein, conserved [Plasmodium ovale curtisi]SCP06079.1 conserved Plasmodium protein, unknown function [Plasmodium ovale]